MRGRHNPPISRRTQAFTLSEILIALLVFSIAGVVLLGLFPLAHRTQRSAIEEARAALIASNIMEALIPNQHPERLQIATGNSNGMPCWESIDPKVSTSLYVGYDSACQPCRPIPKSEATNPIMDQRIAALASVTIGKERNPAHLMMAEVVVESPPSAPALGRTKHRFVRLFPVP